jgi:hypothetical protein
MIAGSTDELCTVDMGTLAINFFSFDLSTNYIRIGGERGSTASSAALLTSTGFLNATNTGNLVAYQPLASEVTRFELSDMGNVSIKDGFVFEDILSPSQGTTAVKCVDIDDINGFLCFKNGEVTFMIKKIN